MLPLHMRNGLRPEFLEKNGALLFIWTLYVLGVTGMISLQSIAVAAAATNMAHKDEARLFRFTLKHSVLLASVIGLITVFYAYVMPAWAP